MDNMNWLWKIFRTMFSLVDYIIYAFVEQVYELFMLIAEAGVFSQDTIQQFAKRIYVFLGLVMIFVVSIALVQYILDPKKFSDSKIGGSKLIKDFVFVLIGIIMIPYIFEAAFKLQRIILKDNVIGSLILGMKYNNTEAEEGESASDYATYGGKIMAYSTLSAFVTFNREIASATCVNEPIHDGVFNASCGDIAQVPFEDLYDEMGNKIENVPQYMLEVDKNRDYRYLLKNEFLNKIYEGETGDVFLIDYSFLISTVGGVFLVYILLGFCLDVAVRSVKLSFLQLIAPIPLMMKIIPGVGDDKFNKWVKQCTSTYLDLFTRLAAIYFAIFIISAITTDGVQNVGGSNVIQTTLVRVAIIIGALMFAGQLPKLLKDLIGSNGDGFKFGGPLKKMMSNPVTGAALAGGAALGVGALGNYKNKSDIRNKLKSERDDKLKSAGLFGNANLTREQMMQRDSINGEYAKAKKDKKVGFLSTAGSVIAGGTSSGAKGLAAGSKAGGKFWSATKEGVMQSSLNRNQRQDGYGIADNMRSEFAEATKTKNDSGTFTKQTEAIKKAQNAYDDAKSEEIRANENYVDMKHAYLNNNADVDLNKFDSMFEREQFTDGTYGDYTANAESTYSDFLNSFETDKNAEIDSLNIELNNMNKQAEEEYANIQNEDEQRAYAQKVQEKTAEYNEKIANVSEKYDSKVKEIKTLRRSNDIKNRSNSITVKANKELTSRKADLDAKNKK